MTILIDAYNLLHSCSLKTDDLAKNNLIKKIEQYAYRSKKNCIIVFDGGSFCLPSISQLHAYCQLVHSGYNSCADSYIIKTINNNNNSQYIVVSYDREILKAANLKKSKCLEPAEFWKIIQPLNQFNKPEFKPKSSQIKKYHIEGEEKNSNSSLDLMMLYYTKKIIFKEENSEDSQFLKSNKLSKKERKKEQIIKNLTKLSKK